MYRFFLNNKFSYYFLNIKKHCHYFLNTKMPFITLNTTITLIIFKIHKLVSFLSKDNNQSHYFLLHILWRTVCLKRIFLWYYHLLTFWISLLWDCFLFPPTKTQFGGCHSLTLENRKKKVVTIQQKIMSVEDLQFGFQASNESVGVSQPEKIISSFTWYFFQLLCHSG